MKDLRMIFSGDLQAQSVASSFGLREMGRPVYQLYGACSTMGEALGLASMAVAGGYADYAAAVTSSHFASAEKEFRFPLEYGSQRPLAVEPVFLVRMAERLPSQELLPDGLLIMALKIP